MKNKQDLFFSRFIYTFILLFLILKTDAQVPAWGWSDSNQDVGDTHYSLGYRLTGDRSGNVIIAATFVDSIIFGGSVLYTNTIGENMIVGKYDHDGNQIWARCSDSVSFTGIVRPTSICTDVGENIYVTGEFQCPTINFGSIILTNTSGVAPFVVKYDMNGNVLWAYTINSSGNNTIMGSATDTTGNLYICGTVAGSPGTLDTISFPTPSNTDAFIAKFDTAGNALWIKIISGPQAESGLDIATDLEGNIYVTGIFESTSLTADAVTLTNSSTPFYGDIFLFKLNNSGNIFWGRSAGSVNGEYDSRVTAAPSGAVYLAGNYMGSCTFNTISVTSGSPGMNLFLTKYDSLGTPLWAKTTSGSSFSGGVSNIDCSLSGDIYLAGGLYEPGVLGTTPLPCVVGTATGLLAAFDPIGTVKWATTYDCPGQVGASDVFCDSAGYTFVTGSFNPTLTLGSTTHGSVYGGFYVASMIPQNSNISSNYVVPFILNIFPNPANENITINFTSSSKNTSIKIYDARGRLVKNMENVKSGESTINISELEAGLYLLNLQDGNTSVTNRFIKQ